MMKFQRLCHLPVLLMSTLLLAACSSPPAQPETASASLSEAQKVPPGTYYCLASSNHSGDWGARAKQRDEARAKAFAQCDKFAANPGSCYVKSCLWKGPGPYPVQGQGNVTCYAKNQDVKGVWSATSQNRNQSIAHAMSRCHANSGAPKACYFTSCQNW